MIQHSADTALHLIRTSRGASTFPARGIVLAIFLIVAIGCAAAPAPPSLPALRTARIHDALVSMAASYKEKDITRFLLYVDPLMAQRSLLHDVLEEDFEVFSEITLTMDMKRVEMTDQRIWTSILWEGRWIQAASVSSVPLDQTGQVLMGWSTDESPRLLEIRGDIPWGVSRVGLVGG